MQKSCQFNRKFSQYLVEKIKPLNPDIKFKKLWDIFFVILSFMNFFILTIEMCFFIDDSSEFTFSSYSLITAIKILNILCYGLDIIMNFCTGYHVGDALVMDLAMIRKKYVGELFFYDILAYIPCVMFFLEKNLQYMSRKFYLFNMFFFFILVKYSLKLKEFREFLIQKEETYENFFSIAILYLRIVVCLWYIVGINSDSQLTWVRVYSIFTILVGFTLFGFTMGSFGDIIRKMNAKDDDFE